MKSPEQIRLEEHRTSQKPWKKWGCYLSERQWGTVREDYSENGTAWEYFSHDQARSRAYRWGEDGIAGISDDQQRLCFSLALWNGKDSILKERMFGLTGNQGNHGEDVKEYYFYLDNTPTHSYMKMLYKYPQAEYPYTWLVEENQRRGKEAMEFELLDTGVFNEDKYYDIFVEYAKVSPKDILIKITACNRGNESATLHLLPTLWFRNTWSWGYPVQKPSLKAISTDKDNCIIQASHPNLKDYFLYCSNSPNLLFTENETNFQRLFETDNPSPYVKDGINNYVVNGEINVVNPDQVGTRASPHYILTLGAGETQSIQLRLCSKHQDQPFLDFEPILQTRVAEANEFYQTITSTNLPDEYRNIQRQAFAGMLWSKQYYRYYINQWLKGDPGMPPPPANRKYGRNSAWFHLDTQEILSMPDKWEYPWFAAWDLAFHTVVLALIDPEFAKNQLDIITREWYMHPNGQLPAYEWNFSDVNPPVHAWAAWNVYQLEYQQYGRKDHQFLERVFQKLLLYFTWWVNRKDTEGKNIFQGGFLGLDNIGVFDRSSALPTGGYLEQSDGTSWMAMYCLNLLRIALELAQENPVYEDIATKFFEHFLYIAAAMNNVGGIGTELWDAEDGFFYDVLHLPNGEQIRLKVRSMVGLIPLFAIEVIEPEMINALPGFKQRLEWFIKNRPDLTENIACLQTPGMEERRLLSIVIPEKLSRLLTFMLSPNEFLSDYGIRALSKYHEENPYIIDLGGQNYQVDYQPAESKTSLFGGNSNWRGPIWLPVNYLLIESLSKFYQYLGDEFKVEFPTGSNQYITLADVSQKLSQRLINIFLQDSSGYRPVYGGIVKFQEDVYWRNYLLFHEYFHGDNGAGIGASHQTGWTGLVAKLIQDW